MILSPFAAFAIATIAMLLPLAWYVRKNPSPNRGFGIDFSNPLYIFSLLYFLSFPFCFYVLQVSGMGRFADYPYSYLNDIFVVFLATVVFLIFFYGFMASSSSSFIGNIFLRDTTARINTLFDSKILLLTLAVVTLLKIVAYVFYLRFSSGLPTGQLSFFYGKGYIVFLFSFFIWFCIVLLIARLFLEPQKKLFIVYAITIICVNMLIFNFLDGSRRYFVMPIMLFLLLLYIKGHINNRHIVFGGLGIITILIILRFNQGIVYETLFNKTSREFSIYEVGRILYVFVSSFDSFWHSSNAIFKYPLEEHPLGIVGFQSLADIFASYIPRALWPSKPDIYGDMLFQNLIYPELYAQSGFNCGRFPLGFVGYAALSFGIVGLILFPLLTGAFYGFLNKFKLTSTLSLALFLWFFGEAFNIIRSGFILGLLQQLVGIALSIAILYAVFICLKACNVVYKTVFAKNG